VSRIVRGFSFRSSPPRLAAEFRRGPSGAGSCDVGVRFWGEDLTFRGVDCLRGDGRLQITYGDGNITVDVRPLMVVRNEGVARGGLTYTRTATEKGLDFDVKSSIDPYALARMVGVLTNNAGRVVTLEAPYRLDGDGHVDFLSEHGVTARFDAEVGEFGFGDLRVSGVSCECRIDGPTNRWEGIRGEWFRGVLAGRVVRTAPHAAITNDRYAVELHVKDADFERFATKLMKADPHEYAGRMNMSVNMGGITGRENLRSATGYGKLRISGGKLLMLPVFGGLSRYLTRLIPGLNVVLSQTDARADVSIENGRIHSDEVRIEGDVLSLLGEGDYHFGGRLDYDVQLTFLKSKTLVAKLLRIPTWIFSKLFEFKLRGSPQDPKWYAVNFTPGGRDPLEEWEGRQLTEDGDQDVVTDEVEP